MKNLIKDMDQSFFYYDLDAFEEHLRSIKKDLDPSIKLWYATKANPLSKVLEILNLNGFGLDVASLGEFKQGLRSGFHPQSILSTGPAKSEAYLRDLMKAGVGTVVVESLSQLNTVNKLSDMLKIRQRVLLRVQLDWDSDTQSVLGGSSITPFGLGLEDWRKIPVQDFAHVEIMGLHCFQWGNVLALSTFEKVWTQTIESCLELAKHLDIDMKIIDLGGGLGISYSGKEKELQFSEVQGLLLKLKERYGLQEIWMELGRYLMGHFGSYFTRIEDIKSVRGKNLLITQGGINHLARPALTGEAFPCVALRESPETTTYRIHGPLCTALDYLGEHTLPSTLEAGDWIEFKKTVAYGFTESMPYFLCHQGAGEVIKYGNDLRMIRRGSETLEWMV
jgi:diaminopimelate decarboxylase